MMLMATKGAPMLTENSDIPLILFVEDDELHVSAMQRSFKNAEKKYQLSFVGTLNDARTALTLQFPDLIITDYKLPDGDGTELLLAANGLCPVILMTSHGSEQFAVNAMKSGVHDYIVKSAAAFETMPLTVKHALNTWQLVVARKAAEETVHHAKQDWEQTFDAVPDLISIIDASHTIIRVNKTMAERCGLTQEELIGRKCHEIMHGTSEPHSDCPYIKMLQDGRGHSVCIEEKRWERTFDITVSPLHDDRGQIRACVHVARDITEGKKAEEERLAMESQFLQTQKLESLGVLAGGIAHDFNNILTIILGHCYIIEGNFDPETDQKVRVKEIEKAAQRAADLCHQMLSYSGKNVLVQTRINLWLMVDENVKMLTSAIKKNVGIELDLTYAVPEINGDSAQIQQVVMNLIINAAEAIGDNNGTLKILLKKIVIADDHAETDFLGNPIMPGSYACLEVTDSGSGMDAETQKRIFEPFFTTKFTGRGLGLSAVLGIIKSHEGALQLLSTPGIGTTFKVYFPSYDKTNIVETKLAARPVPLTTVRGTILLVDDEESIRIIGSALLKAIGFSVITATNGREALEICREQGSVIDLVLLDLLMPVMGGFEAYRKLRKIDPSIPVVICSGCSAEEIQEDIDSDKYAAVIQKPYGPDQLRTTLMKLLNAASE